MSRVKTLTPNEAPAPKYLPSAVSTMFLSMSESAILHSRSMIGVVSARRTSQRGRASGNWSTVIVPRASEMLVSVRIRGGRL